MVQTNNALYKEICESYGVQVTGTHNNNYYLKRIAEVVCGTSYTKTTCNGKYLKDIAEEIGSTTYSSHHFNNFYLKRICIALNPASTYDDKSDNYLLQVWKASVEERKLTTSLTINLDKNFLEIGERVTVSGRLTDSNGNPIANASLISHSNSQTVSITTDANGEYSIKWYYGTSAYNTVTHHYVTYAGDSEYRDSQSETKDVSFRRTSTLSLETPMITYTDEFDVHGSLIDGLGEPISNATVTLTWNDGSDHTVTTTTSPTGSILLHRDAVTTAGTYSFQLSFDGGSRYVASNSSVVNVVPDKEEAVMNITSPASGSTVSDSVTVTGTLKDNDGTAMSGKSVSFSLNNVDVGTATVESDGSFSKTITGLIVGSNSISASFVATTTHTAANQSITLNRPTFDGLSDLSLIAGSQILSYADEQSTPNSQYATLETQLMNGESAAAIEGVSVGFYDYSDENNPVLLGSDDTDSTGKASFTYHSSGVGDVPIKAVVGSILTKTYAIEDCNYYNPNEVTKTNTQSHTLYDSNLSQALPQKCEISCDNYSDNSKNDGEHRFFIFPKSQYNSGTTQPSDAIYWDRYKDKTNHNTRTNGSYGTVYTDTNSPSGSYHHYKLIRDGSTVSIYKDDTLLVTRTLNWLDNHSDYTLSMLRWSTTGTSKIKNVKFKAL